MTENMDNGITSESTTHPIQAPVQVPEVEQEAPDVEPEETQTDEQSPEDSSEKAPKRPGRRERQIERERQENQRLRAELEALKGQGTKTTDNEPQEKDFDNAYDHIKAVAKWEAKQTIQADKAEQQAAAEQREFQSLAQEHIEREAEFAQQTPDYNEKVAAIAQSGLLTPEIQETILRSDMSEKIAYHLANYPSDLMVMQSLKGNKAALNSAISQIENFIESNPIAAVKQTKAAAPITPVASKSATSTKSPADMTIDEIVAWRYGSRK